MAVGDTVVAEKYTDLHTRGHFNSGTYLVLSHPVFGDLQPTSYFCNTSPSALQSAISLQPYAKGNKNCAPQSLVAVPIVCIQQHQMSDVLHCF